MITLPANTRSIERTKTLLQAQSVRGCSLFSVAGNIVTPKRASLNPEKVEQLIVIKCNMQLLMGTLFWILVA